MASKDIFYNNFTYKISYEIINQEISEYILILPGWGATKEIMLKAFKNEFKNIKQIYLDLPGFGSSTINNALKTRDYANIVLEFIKALDKEPIAIMGHSFGGKVATLLNPKNLILLSSAGILEEKPFKVRAKIAIFKCFKVFGLSRFYSLFASKDVAGMSKVMYETLKNVVNEDFTQNFTHFENRALVFWGKDDTATRLKSGEKIHRLIKNSEFYPLDGDHFFFLLHGKFIAQKIEEDLKTRKEK